MSISYATRQAIADLPGKTVRPWQDGDKRCHCTHCDLCGDLYRTVDIGTHERECQAALIAVIGRGLTAPAGAWGEFYAGCEVRLEQVVAAKDQVLYAQAYARDVRVLLAALRRIAIHSDEHAKLVEDILFSEAVPL